MKTVKLLKIPTCNICGKSPAKYDAPYCEGSWTYLCEDCFKGQSNESINYAKQLGSQLILQPPQQPDINETIAGIELTSLEDLMMDEDREVECPKCGSVRTLEIDAHGTYKCECGRTIQMEDRC